MSGSVKFDRSLFTAKFKRDYVAFSAIAIFILIVFMELFLAVSIPTYFVRSNFWDLQIARQDLNGNFDHLRRQCNRFSAKSPELAEENNILLWSLNMMADYIRLNEKRLSREDVRKLKEDLAQMQQLHNRLARGKAFNRAETLKTEKFLMILRTELATGGKK